MMKDESNSYLIIFSNGGLSRTNHSGLSPYWKIMYNEGDAVAAAWPRFPSPANVAGSPLWFILTSYTTPLNTTQPS